MMVTASDAQHRRTDRPRRLGRLLGREQRTSIDPLTGVADEHTLRSDLATRLRDRRYRHHAIAVVKLAEWDMTERVFGAQRTDRVQVDVSRRVRAAVAWLRAGDGDSASTVARIGPGEFAVALHAAGPIDMDLVRRVLTLHSGRMLRLDADRIPLVYELGLQEVDARSDIDLTLGVARLAARRRPAAVDPAPPLLGAPVELARPS